MNARKNKNKSKEFTVAPGLDYHKFGEKVTAGDIKKGNFTKATRVFLDENDPG